MTRTEEIRLHGPVPCNDPPRHHGSLDEMRRDRSHARRLDAAVLRGDDPHLRSLGERLRVAMASPDDDALAQGALNRARAAAGAAVVTTPTVRRAAWRAAALGVALVSGISSAAFVAIRSDERPLPDVLPTDAPAAGATTSSASPDGSGTPDDGPAPSGAPAMSVGPSDAASCLTALEDLDAARARIDERYDAAIREPGVERDEALADLDRALTADLGDLDDEEREINADHRAQMRELEEEWRDADEEERREIEREMRAVQAEWDEAIAEVDAERRAVRRSYDRDRTDVLEGYAQAVADERAERDDQLARIDQQERAVRARCA